MEAAPPTGEGKTAEALARYFQVPDGGYCEQATPTSGSS
jgi:hypothetical protein